jgi:glycosyltransferase involved in cell wall biosynthesis
MAKLPEEATVAIIAPIYNGGPHYHECFESLCKLSYPAHLLQVHVIDDYSSDGTREYLKSSESPAYIIRHYPETNLGRARVRNYALENAVADVVIFLDGDMAVQPDFVASHLSELRKPGRVASIGRVEPAKWLPKTKLHHYLYRFPKRGAAQFGVDLPIGFQYLLTNNVALTKAAYEAGGRFEESFVRYGGEDTLFAYQLGRTFPNGIYYNPGATAYHHHQHKFGPYLEALRHYGRHNLPEIMGRHPEIATPMAADYAWLLPGKFFKRKRRRGSFLFSRLLAWFMRGLLIVTPPPLSDYLIRYLFVAGVVQGLKAAVKEGAADDE